MKKIGKTSGLKPVCLSILMLVAILFNNNGFASDESFLAHLKQTYITTDNLSAAQTFIGKVLKEGSAVQGGTDKEMRSIFAKLQGQLEREMIENLIKSQASVSSPHIRAIWIIHTPLIATPLVTEGEISKGLIAAKILADKEKDRIQTALARAALMREYLAHGGVLIATYVAKPGKSSSGRTPEQMAIFNKLKQQYPQQLIELPIPAAALTGGKFPADKLGATYIVQEPSGYIFEMTMLGTQINDARDGAKWGVWLQERHLPQAQTTQRLCSLFKFLAKAKLKEVLREHALNHQQKPQAYFTLLAPYLVDKKDKGYVPSLLCGETEEE